MRDLFVLFVASFCLLSADPALARKLTEDSPKEYVGVVVLKEKDNTLESYKMGGDVAYYLETTDGSLVPLDSARDPQAVENPQDFAAMQKRLDDLQGQKVTVDGSRVRMSLSYEEHCPDQSPDCPSGPIDVTWVRVKNLWPQEED